MSMKLRRLSVLLLLMPFAGREAALAQAYAPPEMTCAADASATGARAPKKTGYIDDIQAIAREGDDFRRVLYTGSNLQLVVMTLRAGEDTGAETRMAHDTFLRIELGKAQVWIDGTGTEVDASSGIVVPANTLYKLVNTGAQPVHFYVLFGAPVFATNSTRSTKTEADGVPDNFDGCTTE